MKCCICGGDAGKYGNSPWPVSGEGVCCDACNMLVVVPARVAAAYGRRNGKKGENEDVEGEIQGGRP